MRVWSLIFLVCLTLQLALAHRLSLKVLRKLWMKHSEQSDVGPFGLLSVIPRFLFLPNERTTVRKVVVFPVADDFDPPSVRLSRMMEGLDVERLAREWPDSVTPGGPGPEWW